MRKNWSAFLVAVSLAVAAATAVAQGPNVTSGAAATDSSNAPAPQSGNAASPLSFQIGDFNFTPGGFLDFTAMFRTTDVGSGIGTNFASIPYENTVAGRVGETRLSAQNSRFTIKVAGQADGFDVMAYSEADFLGQGPTNQAVTSNSATLRMRVYFVDLKNGNWEIEAGQDWSLMTPNRFGASVMPSDVFYSSDMDTNYQVGLSWARQPQFRLMYHATPHLVAAISAENPEQYIGGGSGSAAVILPGGTSGVYSTQVDSGATSFASPGFAPDFIGKIAYDTADAANKGLHVEATGLESTFRVYTPSTNTTQRIEGGGFSLNAIGAVTPGLRIIATDFISSGGGRYLFGTAPDFIVRQNGTLSGVHADGGILGFECQATPQWMFYGYYGGEWIGKDADYSATAFSGGPSPVGYGFAGSANTNNKSIQEGTIGIINTFWKSPSKGALQLITQGSYVSRTPWYVAQSSGQPRDAHVGMVYVDLRYVLP